MESYSVLQNGRWVDKKREKWVPFYPEFGSQWDVKPPEEVLKQDKIYGKAITGVCGYRSVYTYHTYNREDVRLVQ